VRFFGLPLVHPARLVFQALVWRMALSWLVAATPPPPAPAPEPRKGP